VGRRPRTAGRYGVDAIRSAAREVIGVRRSGTKRGDRAVALAAVDGASRAAV